MTKTTNNADPCTWDPQLDAVIAAPKHHKVIFENERLRVFDVTLEPDDEEPIHHHRWSSVLCSIKFKGLSMTMLPTVPNSLPTGIL